MLVYADHYLTDQQKADLICNYLKTNGPSGYRAICEGAALQLNYYQFCRGVSYISHVMQTVWKTPFGCDPVTYEYTFPQMWDDNIHILSKDLKYIRTRLHKVASNLTASLEKWAGTPDEVEIEDLKISVARLYEDMERTLKRVAKKHASIGTGVSLPAL